MHTNFNTNALEDVLPNSWIKWCRLCAKEDEQTNINFFHQNSTANNGSIKKLNVQEALEKYFSIQAYAQDCLPKMLCTNCLFMISFIIDFHKQVERVQLMFSHIAEMQKFPNSLDLNSMRLKFNVIEYKQNYWPLNFPFSKEDLIIDESSKHAENDEKLEVEIKAEENMETIIAMDYNYVEENKDKQEDDFEDNINDSLPEDEGDPFESNSKEDKSFSDEEVKETFLKTFQNLNKSLSTEKNKVDKSKKKRKRKKFKQFASKEYLKKKRVIKDIKIEAVCKECGINFSKYMIYREHMQQEHNHSKSEKHWQCPICDKTLLSFCNLERHVRIHVPLETRQTFKCNDCDNRYTSNTQLETHIRYKHKNEKPFICEECGLCLRTNSNLRQHMLIHTDLAPYECEVCKKKFKNKTRLKTHMDIHSPNKHVCNICGLQLNSRATLNRHFLVHSDKMQHKCDYCGKAFKRAKALKNHLLLHTGLKPYSCDFCERTFANGSNCRSHMKKMHPEELAILEASGNKTHTKNIPKLETLKAVTKAADNLTPVVTKTSGCFAFGKKPKDKDNSDLKKYLKSPIKQKNTTSLPISNEKLNFNSPNSTPLDLQCIPLVGSTNAALCLPAEGIVENELSSSSNTSTPIPNFDNIYQHILKQQNHTDLQIKQPLTQITTPPLSSNVSTPQHNPFYHDMMNHSMKPTSQAHNDILLQSPESHHSSMITPLTQDDSSNASSINEQFYGSMRTNLPPGSFM